MSPYREMQPVSEQCCGRSRRWTARRKLGGILLSAFALRAIGFTWPYPWALGISVLAIATGLLIAFFGRSRTPFTRLCALQWNRGDRLGAALLFFNVTEPRYSAKRIAWNEAACEAAQVGMMPKHRWFAVLPFID
jgi:hypothetical protein